LINNNGNGNSNDELIIRSKINPEEILTFKEVYEKWTSTKK
jgi:hypothetical protein